MLNTANQLDAPWSGPSQADPQRINPVPSRHLRLLPSPEPEHDLLKQRDPAVIRRVFPYIAYLVDHYYRTEVEGTEHLSDRACLNVSTHNGGLATPDLYGMMVAFWRRFGLDIPGYGMMHKMAFMVPGMGSLFKRLGALHACRENAQIVLRAGYPLMICPGGDLDALKPFRQRHQVVFGPRRGFIRLALEHQVPIIPVVSVGAHETIFVLNDGRRLAELSGAAKIFRIKTIPFSLSFPLGLTLAGLGSIPLPSKVRIRILPRIELAEPARAADDPEAVERCFEHVRKTMQAALDDLASKRKRLIWG